MKLLVSETLKIARSQIGVREDVDNRGHGTNRGTEIEKYLRSIGLTGGYAWCAAFVYWDAQEAANKLRLKNPLPRTGYCPNLERWARQAKILRRAPQIGDIFLCYGSPEGYRRACHTGYVIGVGQRGFATVEGNTNLAGSREGIGVFERERAFARDRYAFIRWADVVNEVSVAPAPSPGVNLSLKGFYDLHLNGKMIFPLPVINGRAYAPVRTWAKKLGLDCAWNAEHQVVMLGGREAPLDLYKSHGMTFAPIRQLVKFSGLKMSVDAKKKIVSVTR